MKTIEEEIQIIKQNLKGIKNEEIRSKAMFMIRALQSGNISLSIDKFGCSGRKFYFWLNRLRKANYDIKKFVEKFGKPDKSQTDNGVEFTNKYLSEENPKRNKEAVLSGYEQYLKTSQIEHKLIRPRTPQLNGKVERFNYTLKRSLRRKLKDGMRISQIQKIVDEFLDWYNKARPHLSLNGLTPYQMFSQNLKIETGV